MKRQTTARIVIALTASLYFGGTGCSDPPPRTLTLAERKLADSLFQEEIKKLKPKLDSLCELRFDSLVASALDSMLEVRKTLMKKQLERLQKEMREE